MWRKKRCNRGQMQKMPMQKLTLEEERTSKVIFPIFSV
jgi:hypothetical protein